MRISYWFMLWLSVATVHGQSIDSLRRVMVQTERLSSPTRRDSVLYTISMVLAQQYRWGSSQAPANMDSAIFFANYSVRLATSQRLRADALRLRGDLYSSNEWGFTSAWMGLDDLNEAGSIYVTLKNVEGLHQTYNTLSVLYLNRYSLRSTPSANMLRYRTLALRVQSNPAFQFSDWVEAPATDSAASPALFREAIQVGEQNLAFWLKRGSKPHRMWRLEYLGGLYRQSELNPIKGKAYQQQAAQIARDLPDYPLLFACLTNLAQWELDDGNYAASLRYAREGLALARQQRFSFRQAGFHDRLYYTFRTMGQMDSAYAHKDEAIAINDSLARVGDQRQIVYLKEKYTAEKRQRELEQELGQQRNLLYILVSVGLLLVGAVGLFIWRNRTLIRKNAELRAAQLQGQTLERQRVAADLHDNLGTTLSALHWNLEAMDTTKLTAVEQALYATISQQVSQAYNDVRLISHNLLPDELAKQGLAMALCHLVDKMNRNTPVRFRLSGTSDLPRLDQQTEFELYSICLELLNNIIKHAHATEGFIDLTPANGILYMTVGDNGTGIDNQRTDGRGLHNVAARVDSLAGTWIVDSTPDGGVQNRISVPVRIQARVSSQT
ncbi:sensor histidine kinase [Spirosoma arcticum]